MKVAIRVKPLRKKEEKLNSYLTVNRLGRRPQRAVTMNVNVHINGGLSSNEGKGITVCLLIGFIAIRVYTITRPVTECSACSLPFLFPPRPTPRAGLVLIHLHTHIHTHTYFHTPHISTYAHTYTPALLD